MKYRRVLAVALLLLIALSAISASAQIKTYLTFRVTTRAQSAVVNVGEDLQIDVGIEGANPTRWQWFFGGKEIEVNGDDRVYNIINAQPEDAGIYRLCVYDESSMLASIEVNVRVIDPLLLPRSGDDSLPVELLFAALMLSAGVGAMLIMKRRRSA